MYIKRIFLAAFALLFAAGFCLAQPVNIDPRTQCPPITPAWAFGHIVWEDNVNTTQGAEDLVNGYLDRGIPVDAVIIDSPWSTTYNDFEWDSARYADPSAMIRGFQQKGVRTILWLTGFVNEQGKDTRLQKSATFDEVVSRGYAVNGGKSVNWWKGRGVHIDFTNAEAVQWWNSQLDKVAGGTQAEIHELMYFYEDQGHDCRDGAKNWIDVANKIRGLLAKDLGVEWDEKYPVSMIDKTRSSLHVHKPSWYTIKGKRYNHEEIMQMLREKYKG